MVFIRRVGKSFLFEIEMEYVKWAKNLSKKHFEEVKDFIDFVGEKDFEYFEALTCQESSKTLKFSSIFTQ